MARVAGTLGLFLIGAVLIIGGRAAAAPQATIIRCDPATIAGPLGSTIDIDIYVENVVDLWAGDVQLAFDTTALQVVDAQPSEDDDIVQLQPLDTFMSPDMVVRNVADNAAGTIWYAATQVNPTPPVSGSGPLARVTFQALRTGQFTLPITYHKIVLRTGIEIPSTPQGCSVTFIDADSGGVTFVPFTAAAE